MGKRDKKEVRGSFNNGRGKGIPSSVSNARTDPSSQPQWKFAYAALSDDVFGWGKIGDHALTVVEALSALEGQTWQELCRAVHGYKGKTKHHCVKIDALTGEGKEAYYRKFPDPAQEPHEIFSLRLNGKCRIIGYRKSGAFHAIWFDPEHQFVQTEK